MTFWVQMKLFYKRETPWMMWQWHFCRHFFWCWFILWRGEVFYPSQVMVEETPISHLHYSYQWKTFMGFLWHCSCMSRVCFEFCYVYASTFHNVFSPSGQSEGRNGCTLAGGNDQQCFTFSYSFCLQDVFFQGQINTQVFGFPGNLLTMTNLSLGLSFLDVLVWAGREKANWFLNFLQWVSDNAQISPGLFPVESSSRTTVFWERSRRGSSLFGGREAK